MNNYFEEAIKLAKNGVKNKEGGPFGAVVVDNKGRIVGYGNNQVLKNNDPTAHAEVTAIRDACKKLNTYDLSECKIYTTSEPCPMCLGAIIWSNIKEVYYATSRKDVDKIGFRDEDIYDYLEGKNKKIIKLEKIEDDKCEKLLDSYKNTIY